MSKSQDVLHYQIFEIRNLAQHLDINVFQEVLFKMKSECPHFPN